MAEAAEVEAAEMVGAAEVEAAEAVEMEEGLDAAVEIAYVVKAVEQIQILGGN